MYELVIRRYRPEDYSDVIKLYNSTGTGSPFLARDGQYFNYFLSHPGVRQDSIFVAASEDGVEGVSIIAINQDERYTIGKIIELWASGTVVGSALVQKAVEYCCDKGVDRLEVSPPAFLDSGKTFAGWQKISQRGVFMVKPLSLKPLLKALFDVTALKRIGPGKGFAFVCGNETIRVKITGTSVNIEDNKSPWDGSHIMVRVSPQTLLELIFGSANPYIALLTGRIKIRPLRSTSRALEILRAIRISQAWSLAIVDSR